MTRKSIALLMLPLSLAACGKFGALEPPQNRALPPLAYGQNASEDKDTPVGQTAETLTAPSAQARPGRSVELLSRSERRGKDPFDLAPGSEPEADYDDGQKNPDAGADQVSEAPK